MNENPYATPSSELTEQPQTQQYDESGFFSAAGRIGRVRFLAYFGGLYFVLTLTMRLFAVVSLDVLNYLVLAGFMVGYFILVIRRLHDKGATGWWSLLALIPIVNLVFLIYLCLAEGDAGANDYGFPAPPSTLGLKIVAFLIFTLFLGSIAAVAWPAYQDYVDRTAKQAEFARIANKHAY